VFIAHASDDKLWGSVAISANGNTNYAIFCDDAVAIEGQLGPFHPPFFVAPKNPGLLFFSATARSVQQYSRGGSIISVRGAPAMFLETSDCIGDCSLKGFCYAGSCTCFEEYFGHQCQDYCNDLKTCHGHGFCDFNGNCDCDPNWSGPGCAQNDLTPPVFPKTFTVTNVMYKNLMYNQYYDYEAQHQKLVYRNGLNITSLYERGVEYFIYPDSCSYHHLQEPFLALWQVPNNATLLGYNIKCATNHLCSLWKTFETEWLVTMDNIPVRINTTEGVYLFDPSKFVIAAPDPRVFQVPENCTAKTI